MAKKEGSESAEMFYNIPLRSEWLKEPRGKRCKSAVNAIKRFLVKHAHASDVKLSPMVNEFIWARGIEKPPGRIRVKVKRDGDVLMVKLPEEKEVVEEKEEKKGLKDKLKEKAEESKKAMTGAKKQ